MLRRGLPVADILYLTPEGAPHVFRPPASATTGDPPDRRGYNFDGVSPEVLIKSATVMDGQIAFPGGMTYRVLVLPRCEAMTPGLVKKIKELVEAGATVIGHPPRRSPSLAGYPQCDEEVKRLAAEIWGPAAEARRSVGNGTVIRPQANAELYPDYAITDQILSERDLRPDFLTSRALRCTHRRDGDSDIYFLANCRNEPQLLATCHFRAQDGRFAEWWDPLSGQRFAIHPVTVSPGPVNMPTSWFVLNFAPYQSAFIVFRNTKAATPLPPRPEGQRRSLTNLAGPWEVSFDPAWGGPEKIGFEKLDDWTQRPEEGIRHYSGKAVYRKRFDLSSEVLKHAKTDYRLSLGTVHDMASVKLNGRDLGVVWCDPWEVELPPALLREKGNELEITVANRWPNRLIGDQALPPEKRRTKTTWNPFHKDSRLLPSGLIGPVQIMATE